MEWTSPEAEFQALRHAADRGDWNGCIGATEKLLQRLPAEQALALVWEQVSRRLPAFEQDHPGVGWPRRFIEASRQAAPSMESPTTWPEEDGFSGPGANSYIHAVDALWRGSRRALQEPAQAVELLVEAISATIMAEKLRAWGSRHPTEWARWYESAKTGESDPERARVLLTIKLDPDAARIQRTAWHAVADRLAETLGIRWKGP